MYFKSLQIADSVFDELRPDQLPVFVPLRPIGRKDTVPEKVLPVIMERFALAVVRELSCENCFDVLRVCGEQ